jgi:hypothetical protein
LRRWKSVEVFQSRWPAVETVQVSAALFFLRHGNTGEYNRGSTSSGGQDNTGTAAASAGGHSLDEVHIPIATSS